MADRSPARQSLTAQSASCSWAVCGTVSMPPRPPRCRQRSWLSSRAARTAGRSSSCRDAKGATGGSRPGASGAARARRWVRIWSISAVRGDAGDDPHGPATRRTRQRVHLEDLPDEGGFVWYDVRRLGEKIAADLALGSPVGAARSTTPASDGSASRSCNGSAPPPGLAGAPICSSAQSAQGTDRADYRFMPSHAEAGSGTAVVGSGTHTVPCVLLQLP
jgi:hypothetical protein